MTLPLTMVIPVFDRQRELDEALLSIARQPSLPCRVIVVDDGSHVPVRITGLEGSRLQVDILRHAENRGASAARNTGLKAAETDWVSFLDSDDYLNVNTLTPRWDAVQHALDQGADQRTIFGCGWRDVGSDGAASGMRWPRPGRSPADFASGCWFAPGSCIILHRKQALAIGLQDESLRRFEDLDWFFRLSLEGFRYLPTRIAGASVSRRRGSTARVHATVCDASRRLLSKWSGKVPPHLERRLKAYMALEISASAYYCGEPLEAAKAMVRSYALMPRIGLQFSPGWDIEAA
jgi:glycosyltransferase involved in cell wall biosynthesis